MQARQQCQHPILPLAGVGRNRALLESVYVVVQQTVVTAFVSEKTHLLLGRSTGTGPFDDNVFFGFCVCRKGEGDTREGRSLDYTVVSTCVQVSIEERNLLTKSIPTMS